MLERVREEIARIRCLHCEEYSYHKQSCLITPHLNKFCPDALGSANQSLIIKIGNHTLKEIIEMIDKGELVKLAKDQSLPYLDITTESYPQPCNSTCHRAEQSNILRAGFHRVEPLKGEHD